MAVLLTLVTCSIPVQKVPSLPKSGCVVSSLLYLAEQRELLGDAVVLCVGFFLIFFYFLKSKNLPVSHGHRLQDLENSGRMSCIVEIAVVD